MKTFFIGDLLTEPKLVLTLSVRSPAVGALRGPVRGDGDDSAAAGGPLVAGGGRRGRRFLGGRLEAPPDGRDGLHRVPLQGVQGRRRRKVRAQLALLDG